MSILKRIGWANREIINEGLLHSDGLKQRITNLFKRTSLGNSPTYVVCKIANTLREELGEDYDINEVTDEDIIRIANSESITKGKFIPELRDGIANARQENEGEMSDVIDSGLPSNSSDDNDFEDFYEDELNLGDEQQGNSVLIIKTTPIKTEDDDLEMNFTGEIEEDEEHTKEHTKEHSDEDADEAAEEVKTCGCHTRQSPFYAGYAKNNIKKIHHPKEITKENVKLSKEQVNKLLQENYMKSRQHKFKQEERYRNY